VPPIKSLEGFQTVACHPDKTKSRNINGGIEQRRVVVYCKTSKDRKVLHDDDSFEESHYSLISFSFQMWKTQVISCQTFPPLTDHAEAL